VRELRWVGWESFAGSGERASLGRVRESYCLPKSLFYTRIRSRVPSIDPTCHSLSLPARRDAALCPPLYGSQVFRDVCHLGWQRLIIVGGGSVVWGLVARVTGLRWRAIILPGRDHPKCLLGIHYMPLPPFIISDSLNGGRNYGSFYSRNN